MLRTLALVSSHDELTTLQKKLSLPSGCGRTATREAGFAKILVRVLVVEKKNGIRDKVDRTLGCGIVVKMEREPLFQTKYDITLTSHSLISSNSCTGVLLHHKGLDDTVGSMLIT